MAVLLQNSTREKQPNNNNSAESLRILFVFPVVPEFCSKIRLGLLLVLFPREVVESTSHGANADVNSAANFKVATSQ